MKDQVRRRPVSLARLDASRIRKKSMAVSIGGRSAPNSIRREASQNAAQDDNRLHEDNNPLLKRHEDNSESISTSHDSVVIIDHTPPVQLPPEIPENTTGKPTIGSFCSSFKVKQPKQSQETTPNQAAANHHVPETANNTNNNRIIKNNDTLESTGTSVAASGPVVQIINGEIVVQESSLDYFENGNNNNQIEDSTENYTIVEEDTQLAVVNANYTSFLPENKQRKGNSWGTDDTIHFYHALRQVGLDFCTMELMFNDEEKESKPRTRKQLKRKYQMEMIRNPELVAKAMNPDAKIALDLSVFQITEQAIREIEVKRAQELEVQTAAIAAKKENIESMKQDENHNDELEEIDETEEINDKNNQLRVSAKLSDSSAVKVQRSEQVMWSFLDNNNPSASDSNNNEDNIHEIHPDDVDNDDLYKDPLLAAELPTTSITDVGGETPPTISLFPMTDNKRKAIGKKKTKPNFRTKRNK